MNAPVSSASPLSVPIPEPGERPRRRAGRHLRPVERPRTRRSPAVPVLVGSGIVVVALFALAAMHALLINGQIRLDDLRREEASGAEEVRQLRLRVAELEAPDRVLEAARDRLGMVDPGEVGYLLPVGVAGGDETPVRVAAAEPPPPPAPVIDSSPEQREVEDGLSPDAPDGASDTDATDGDETDTETDSSTNDDASTDDASTDGAATATAPGDQVPDVQVSEEGAPDGSGE